jgi:hypothetical protein
LDKEQDDMAASMYINSSLSERAKYVASQSERSVQAVLREAVNLGLLLLLAGSVEKDGHYADLSAEELAARLRPQMIQLLDLMHRQGTVPSLMVLTQPYTVAATSGVPGHLHSPPSAAPTPAPPVYAASVSAPPAAVPHPSAAITDDDLLAELLDAGCVLLDE